MESLSQILRRLGRSAGILVAVVAALLVGFWARGCLVPAVQIQSAPSGTAESTAEKGAERYICPMHPHISSDEPGRCRICGMLLVLTKVGADVGPRTFRTTESARALMEVQTAPVQRRFVTAEVRMVGKVEYDETRVRDITAWVGGRLDRLYVDYTGVKVSQGDHMVYIYSPELLHSQEALLQALKALEEDRPGELTIVKELAADTLQSARGRLLLMGLSEEQIVEIERRGEPVDHLTINAPIGGTVIKKHAQEGMYVKTGTHIYTIADLTHVWVKLDAYESDLMWVRYGQRVVFTADAYPGETFEGTISLVHPTLESGTQTVEVRVNVPNPDGRLKPGMFVRGVVRAQIAAGGKVVAPDLAGKWLGPMHPEVVKDAPGVCDVCGMPLVSAESLGYVAADEDAVAPLVIPATAPLITGKRAVVYVDVTTDQGKPTYEGRVVVLGPRAGDYYLVRSGLKEGEMVVTHGNFKIDSELQIQAKLSMMSPVEAPAAFREQLAGVLAAYAGLHAALAADNDGDATEAAARVQEAHDAVDMALLKGATHMAWMKDSDALKLALQQVLGAKDIEGRREGFAAVSEALTRALKRYGPVRDAPVYVLKCPMALDGEGGIWLQDDRQTRNPYYGADMLQCGDVIETLSGEPTKVGEDE